MFSVIPALLATAGTAFIFFYKLERATVDQVEKDLQERHEYSLQNR
jgi:Na+/melibiose symporter-like transporter